MISQNIDLEARIVRLEDIEEVKKLMAQYAYYVDSFQHEMVIDLYADNAVVELSLESLPNNGIYRGKEEIVHFYRDWLGSLEGRWVSHNMQAPLVEVQGNWGSGICYFLAMTMYDDMAYWTHARMDNVYEKIGGKWFIKRERIVFNICRSPYDKGWHKEGFVRKVKPGQPQHPRPVDR